MDGEIIDLTLSYKLPTLVLTSSFSKEIRDKIGNKLIIDYVPKSKPSDISYVSEIMHTLLYFQNMEILIVTDNKKEQTILSLYLSSLSFKPIFTDNVVEAIVLLENNKVDMIILSYHEGFTDGYKLVDMIRGKFSLYEKLIFTTISNNDKENSVLFLKNGVNEIITTPYNKDEFTAKILKELNNKKKNDEINQMNKTVEEYVIISKTDSKGIITHASDAFCKISGYSKDELIGKPQNIVRHPDMKPEVFKELWKTIKSGKIYKGILKNRKKDGTAYWVNTVIVPIHNENNKVIEYMAIRHDITELYNLHKEIEDTQKEIVYKMGEVGESRSKETGNHVKRVALYSKE